MSSLHTIGAVSTIDRIIDVFPSDQQQQVRLQFALTVQAIVSQQLLPAADGTMVPAPSRSCWPIRPFGTLIREGKTHQLNNTILNGQKDGMTTMDADILRLYREGAITRETALAYAFDPRSRWPGRAERVRISRRRRGVLRLPVLPIFYHFPTISSADF